MQTTGHRSNPDVAYDADPYSGFYVCQNNSWYAVGGTSAGAPQWAALMAIANQGRAADARAPLSTALQAVYSLAAGDFHDITIGSNGYRAGAGYDAVTGRGSPFANAVIRDLVAFGAATTTASTHSTTPPPAAGPTSGPRMQKADEIVAPAENCGPSTGSWNSFSTADNADATSSAASHSANASQFSVESTRTSASRHALDSLFDLDEDQFATLDNRHRWSDFCSGSDAATNPDAVHDSVSTALDQRLADRRDSEFIE